ncbi:eukaryotic translation initiation factor 4E [Savitreella phatthalungensis]
MTDVETKPLETLKEVDIAADDSNTSTADKQGSSQQTEDVTVFHDADNFTVKHPLAHRWTLWYTKPPTPGQRGADAWADNLKEVITIDSVEEFWGVYNNIAKATELSQKSDYHLFKEGVRPEWEDKQNSKGGKWAFQSKGASKDQLDGMWLYSMLAAIGETLERDNDNEVMGVVVNIRKGLWRISVWTRSCNNKDALMEIGRRFKDVLKLPAHETLEFASHNDAAHSGSSRAKAKMSV